METRTFSMEIKDHRAEDIAKAGNPGYKKEIIQQCYELDHRIYRILTRLHRNAITLEKDNEYYNYQGQMNLFTSLQCAKVLKSSNVLFEQKIQIAKQLKTRSQKSIEREQLYQKNEIFFYNTTQ